MRGKPLLGRDSRSWDATPRRCPGKLHVGVADLPPGLLNLITANFARAKRSPIFVYSLCSRLDPASPLPRTILARRIAVPSCRSHHPFCRPLLPSSLPVWIKVFFAVLNYRRINFQFVVVTFIYRIDSTVSIWDWKWSKSVNYELSLRDVFYFVSCKIMSEFDKLYSYRIILIYLRDYNWWRNLISFSKIDILIKYHPFCRPFLPPPRLD